MTHARKKQVWPQYVWKDIFHPSITMDSLEAEFFEQAEKVHQIMADMSAETRTHVEAGLLAREAVASFAIDGVELRYENVVSELLELMGVNSPHESSTCEIERAAASFIHDAHVNFDKPLTKKRLCSWHASIMDGCVLDCNPGVYRTAKTRFKGRCLTPITRHDEVPGSMREFIDGFNNHVMRQGQSPYALIRAAEVHMNFMQIQPFEAGNARIARALAGMVISHKLECATHIKLSYEFFRYAGGYSWIQMHEKATTDLSAWMHYLGQMANASAERTLREISGQDERPRVFNDRTAGWLEHLERLAA